VRAARLGRSKCRRVLPPCALAVPASLHRPPQLPCARPSIAGLDRTSVCVRRYVLRAFNTLEGVGKTLDPDYDISRIAKK
jgi:hypothetical protein